MAEKLLKYFPLVKIDDQTHMIYGLATCEKPDKTDEIADYEQHKQAYKAWSDEAAKSTSAAGQELSLGNIRLMHQLKIAGKAIKIDFDDATKSILIGSEPLNEEIWQMAKKGFIRGYSQGGSYLWKKADGPYVRYGSTIGELSYVDNPCLENATFQYIRADGSTELCKFAPIDTPADRLSFLYDELAKLEGSARDSGLDTQLQKFEALLGRMVGNSVPEKEPKMTPEQIKKAAAAIGMSEEDFKKLLAGPADTPEELAKAGKGLAALHAHLKKAVAHHGTMAKCHGEMSDMHKTMGEHHKTMGEHLENCMKAHGACQDGAEADKILKAAAGTPDPTPASAAGLGEDKVATMIAEALKTQRAEMEKDFAEKKLFVVERGTPAPAAAKAAGAGASGDPLPL